MIVQPQFDDSTTIGTCLYYLGNLIGQAWGDEA